MKNKKCKYKLSIVGLGNYLMGDDGIGCELIKNFRKEKMPSDINLIEAGTAPINYLEEISHSREIIAVDAIKGGEKPGTIYRLSLEDLKETAVRDLHGFSLYNVIKISQNMTDFPVKVTIYGIEPKNIYLSLKLTMPVKKSLFKLKKVIKTHEIFNNL